MNVTAYKGLHNILSGLVAILEDAPQSFLLRRDAEPSPDSINISFKPVVPEKVVEKVLTPGLCTACEKRINYKPNQFEARAPKYPYLILVHNPRAMSKDRVYEGKEENELFEKMIEATYKKKASDFLVRDAVRCNFGTIYSNLAESAKACRTHVEDDIAKYNIKGVIVIGRAANLLVQDKQKLAALSQTVTPFFSVPTIFVSGPERIVALRKKNAPEEETYKARRSAYDSLKLFEREVMEK